MIEAFSFHRILLIILSIQCFSSLHAASIRGKILDRRNGDALIGVTVLLTNKQDSTDNRYTSTNNEGLFFIRNLATQNYRLEYSYLGYKKHVEPLKLGGEDRDLGTIYLVANALELEEVQIKATAVRATQRGDTIEFNADAYKVNADANAEDLIKKLPGVSVEDGTVKTQGEDITRVLVDGKPFFGDDPSIAIKNLPAEVIDKIEVFDKQSEQSQLTGFDDGNAEKTINIITRKNRRMGQFGKLYAGGGLDDIQKEGRYSLGGNFNMFDDKHRISIIGMSNNVNQQTFAAEDLVNMSTGSGSGRRVRQNNFAGNTGVATTHALGINYADLWWKKVEVTASYFFNYADNLTRKDLTRQYFLREDSLQLYQQNTNATTQNQNHRANIRMDYKINDNTSVLYIPSFSFQNNLSKSVNNSEILDVNSANTTNIKNRQAFNLTNELLIRHKFEKKGRTISTHLRANISDHQNNSTLHSTSSIVDDNRHQQAHNPTNNWSAKGNLAYTEPINKLGLLQFNYEFSKTYGESNKTTYNLDSLGHIYEGIDSLYSNIYRNNYLTQRLGIHYRMKTNKLMSSISIIGENAQLNGKQIMPYRPLIKKQFKTLLPMAMFEYKFNKQKSLRLFYRTSTNAPSLTQLQDVVNNTNPLLLTSGNSDLSQTYTQRLSLRYQQTSLEKGVTFFAMLYAANTNNNITTKTITASSDTLLQSSTTDSIWLRKGSQYSTPINLDGYWNTRGVLSLGIPVSPIKSNLNLNSGISYSRQPGFVNDLENISNTYNLSGGLVLSSNISENIDFTLSYNASYNITMSTLQARKNDIYFKHNANLKGDFILWKDITLQVVSAYEQYRGLAEGYNQEYIRLDASLGKKFLKGNRGELKFFVYDLLNQNQNYGRSVTESYIEDWSSNVLSRYFLLSFTYTLRNIGKMPKTKSDAPEREYRSTPPSGTTRMMAAPPSFDR
ncbi:MAG: outer membrane beta-barrel protein [Bacteroidales bacterium]